MRRYQIIRCQIEVYDPHGITLAKPEIVSIDGVDSPVSVTTNAHILGNFGFTVCDLQTARHLIKRLATRRSLVSSIIQLDVQVFWGPFWRTWRIQRPEPLVFDEHLLRSRLRIWQVFRLTRSDMCLAQVYPTLYQALSSILRGKHAGS